MIVDATGYMDIQNFGIGIHIKHIRLEDRLSLYVLTFTFAFWTGVISFGAKIDKIIH